MLDAGLAGAYSVYSNITIIKIVSISVNFFSLEFTAK